MPWTGLRWQDIPEAGPGSQQSVGAATHAAIIGNSPECRRDGQLRMNYGGKRHHVFASPGVEQPGLLLERVTRELPQRYG